MIPPKKASRAALTLGVVASVVMLPLLARAQDAAPTEHDIETARTHYEAGVSYYEQLRYDEAAREFREAFRLSHRSHLLKNVATSLQHASHWAESADAYAEYLELTPDAEDRAAVEARIARLRELAADAGATQDQAPEAAPLVSEDGTSEVATRPHGEDGGGDEDGGGGGPPVVPIVLLGVGGALGIAALVTGLLAHDVYGDLDSMCGSGVCDPSLEGDRDRGQTLAITSTILTGAAIVAGAIGIVLWLVSGGDDDDEPAEPAVSAWLDPEGAGVVLRGEL